MGLNQVKLNQIWIHSSSNLDPLNRIQTGFKLDPNWILTGSKLPKLDLRNKVELNLNKS